MTQWSDNPLMPAPRRADALGVSTQTADTTSTPFAGAGLAEPAVERFADAEGAFTDVPAVDRRRSRRSRQDVPGWLSPTTGKAGNGQRVRVTDLSLHGAGFESDVPLAPKAAHWFVVTSGALRLSCRLRVVSVEPSETGYTIGAEFF